MTLLRPLAALCGGTLIVLCLLALCLAVWPRIVRGAVGLAGVDSWLEVER
jgi:hypothetical protein